MKKSFFYLAAGALALTACTSEEVLDESSVHSNAIGFENVVSKQTRATEISNGTFNQFGVFAYYAFESEATPDPNHGILVFNNQEVNRKEQGSTDWTYENTRYWVPDATYYFYAYSCGGVKLSKEYGTFSMDVNQTTKEGRAFKITNYVCDDTHQHDLLFAKQENIKASNSTVKFKFNHILTKVNAKFFSDFAPEYTIEISNVTISNIRNQGDYASYENKGWTNQKRVNTDNTVDENPIPSVTLLGTYKDENGDNKAKTIVARKKGTITPPVGSEEPATEVEALEPSTDIAFVLPYNYTQDEAKVRISFSVVIKKDNDVVLSREMNGTWLPTWQEGYEYTYNILINGDATDLTAIVFQTDATAINDWKTTTEDDTNTPTITITTGNNQ